jgi:hypothetical protein
LILLEVSLPSGSGVALCAGFGINLFGKVTERVMVARERNEGRKFFVTNLFGALAALCERAAGRKMRNIRRQSGYLIERALF